MPNQFTYYLPPCPNPNINPNPDPKSILDSGTSRMRKKRLNPRISQALTMEISVSCVITGYSRESGRPYERCEKFLRAYQSCQ